MSLLLFFYFSGIEDEVEEEELVIRPRVKSPLKPQDVTVGGTATFDLQISGTPEPSVMWTFEGKELSSNEKYKIEKKGDGAHSLSIVGVTEENGGSYKAEIRNKGGKEVSEAYLNVISKCPFNSNHS